MTKEEFTRQMKNIATYNEPYRDAEVWHQEADALIIEYLTANGCEEAAKIFDNMEKWYA